jgi:hypothetical protein
MVHRHHAIALDHSVVGRQVLLRDGGVVGRRVGELLAHELRHPIAVLVGAACDAGDNEGHCGAGDMGRNWYGCCWAGKVIYLCWLIARVVVDIWKMYEVFTVLKYIAQFASAVE